MAMGNCCSNHCISTVEMVSIYLFENDTFNGTVIPMWDSKSKNTAIDNFVEKYNIDLSISYAYGDTNGDVTMLKRAGNRVAINPTKELLNHMNQEIWVQILDGN